MLTKVDLVEKGAWSQTRQSECVTNQIDAIKLITPADALNSGWPVVLNEGFGYYAWLLGEVCICMCTVLIMNCYTLAEQFSK